LAVILNAEKDLSGKKSEILQAAKTEDAAFENDR
jgi:hypothetical protein